jgi:cell wall assembly regulator SMI1
MVGVHEVTASWTRIENWLREHAPVTLASLRPPASAAQLRAARDRLGLDFAESLSASLERHDGVEATRACFCLPATFAPLSVDEIVQAHASLLGVLEDVGPQARGEWWDPNWLPFAQSVGADLLVVDCAPGPDGGRLGVFDHTLGARFDATTLAGLLGAVADALESGQPLNNRRATPRDDALRWEPFNRPPPEVLERARRYREQAAEARAAAENRGVQRRWPRDR